MKLGNENVKTFSVRQLANLFGRSEQTIRRWKDKGINGVKLADGFGWEENEGPDGEDEGGRAGSLVFTVDAVREFVDANPSLMDGAAPELELLLYGRKSGLVFSKRGKKSFSMGLVSVDSEQHRPFMRTAGMTGAGKSNYIYQLLLSREQEVRQSIEALQLELEQIQSEKTRLEGVEVDSAAEE